MLWRYFSRKVYVQVEFSVTRENVAPSFSLQKEAKPKACDDSSKTASNF